MELRPLGRTALSVSAVGFGCGSTGGLFVRGTPLAQRRAVEVALEGGINYFDTAAQYGDGRSEENLGRVLRELGCSVHVGTKVRLTRPELARADSVVRTKLEGSLRRLGLERVDVVALHSRLGDGPDDLCAREVTGPVAESMHEVVEAGLAKVTGFTGLGQTDEILAVAGSRDFGVFQCYFNVLNASAAEPGSPDGVAQDFRGVLEVATGAGLGAFGIRVLAGGALGGRDKPDGVAQVPGSAMADGADYEEDLRRAGSIASHLGDLSVASLPELAFRYALSEHRLSSILVGFSDETDVREALGWESLGALTGSQLNALRQIATR